MDNKQLVVTGAVAVVGIAVGALVGGYLAGGPTERATTAIVLTQRDARCEASDPISLQVRRGAQVQWAITNNCTDPQFARMQTFQLRNQQTGAVGAPERVTDPEQPTTTAAIQPGQTVTVTARNIADHGGSHDHYVYKYQIWTGTSQATLALNRDPDYETWDK